MDITPFAFYNSLAIALELIAVIALWGWLLLNKFPKLGAYFKVEPRITEVSEEDPNRDLKEARDLLIDRSYSMLPVIAAIASLDVLFSKPTVSYFTLFPLVISLLCYYVVTTGNLSRFKLNTPRAELVSRPNVRAAVLEDDNKARKELLRGFINRYRFQVAGHLNFLVATGSFLAGTIISRSFHLTSEGLIFAMCHAVLLSYIVAFLAEVLLFRHRLTAGT